MGVVVGVYRLALAAITFVALFWTPSEGVSFDIEDYVYFTNQSNLLLAVVMLWGGVAVLARRTEPKPWLWGAVTLFILITGLVSYLILDPAPPGEEVIALGLTHDQLVHRLTPIAAFVHFLLMVPHRRLRVRNAAWWLDLPGGVLRVHHDPRRRQPGQRLPVRVHRRLRARLRRPAAERRDLRRSGSSCSGWRWSASTGCCPSRALIGRHDEPTDADGAPTTGETTSTAAAPAT